MTAMKAIVLLLLCSILSSVIAQDVVCRDGTECQNGSTCIPLENGVKAFVSFNVHRRYRCDCSKTIGVQFYAGYECEYPADETCLYGEGVDTRISFCTNGGCLEVSMPEKGEIPTHKGCECNDGYEGEYCEYITGDAPQPASKLGLILGLIVTFTALSTLSGCIVIRNIRQKKAKMVEAVVGNSSSYDDDVKVHQSETEMI